MKQNLAGKILGKIQIFVQDFVTIVTGISGTVYNYHGYFRFGSGFMPSFVKFYGSLMAHGYGSEKLRVVTALV